MLSSLGAWLVLTVLAVALLLVAVDGDDDSSDSDGAGRTDSAAAATRVLTPERYVTRANRACLSSLGRFLEVELPAEDDGAAARRVVEEVFVPTFREQLRTLRLLRPQRSFARRVDPVIRTFDRETERLADDPVLIADDRVLQRVTRRFERLGLTYCGVPD